MGLGDPKQAGDPKNSVVASAAVARASFTCRSGIWKQDC